MHILLIEDDSNLATGLEQSLSQSGFVVNSVTSGKAGIHSINSETPDMVILDIGLPDMTGLELMKKIRPDFPELPVIMLTARDTMLDKVEGLDAGADDYLTKPFDVPELIARLRVIERRLSTTHSSDIVIGDVCLDTLASQVRVENEVLQLSRREYMLLKALMENAGKVLSKEQLETKLYHWGEEVSSNTIEVHIHNLRKKLKKDFIRNIRGIGYTINKL